MRYLPLVLLAACERTTTAPTTVVLFDELADRPVLEQRPTAEPIDFHFGCKLAAVKDYAVIQCLDSGVLVRFHCADLPGPAHAIGFVVHGEPMKIYCR